MATSTYKTFLMYKASSSAETYTKLVDIKDYPDMGEAPDMLDTTTLSDGMRTYIPGLKDAGSGLAFTANYDEAVYTTLDGLVGNEYDFALWLGGTESGGVATPTGADGKFSFKGQLTVRLLGKGVNDVREMEINIAPSTAITFAAGT